MKFLDLSISPCSTVSIVNFEQVNAGWDNFILCMLHDFILSNSYKIFIEAATIQSVLAVLFHLDFVVNDEQTKITKTNVNSKIT